MDEEQDNRNRRSCQIYWAVRKEGNVLFNDALNTFYLQLYGFRHMVKDYSDSERGNLFQPHGQLFLISSKNYFKCIITQTGEQPLLHQSWSTGWNENKAVRNTVIDHVTKAMVCAIMSVRWWT